MASVPVDSPGSADSIGEGAPDLAAGTNGRRRVPPPRFAGLKQAFVSSRNYAFLAALLIVARSWPSAHRELRLVFPLSIEALVAALFFLFTFGLAWAVGGLGAFAGWVFGRRYGRPREGASGGALGCWLSLALIYLLVRTVGQIVPIGAGLLLLVISPWIGARWLGPLTGRLQRGWNRLPTQFNAWASRYLILRRPRIDVRGPALGAAAGLLAGLVTLLPPLQYMEALVLAARIRVRNQPIQTTAGTIEWQQALPQRLPTQRRRPPAMAILEMDDSTIGQALSRASDAGPKTSEAGLNAQLLERLRGWGARRIVVPVAATMPREDMARNPRDVSDDWLHRQLRDWFYWRRPPLSADARGRMVRDTPRLAGQLRRTPQAILCLVPASSPFDWYHAVDTHHGIRNQLIRGARQVGSAELGVYYVSQLPTLRLRDGAGRPAVPLLLGRPRDASAPRRGEPSPIRPWDPKQLPVVQPGELLLNIGTSTPGALAPHVSYSRVLMGQRIYNPQTGQWQPPERFFRNRIVFLDSLYQPQYDTAIGHLTAMELQAVAFDNLTRSGPLSPWSPAAQILATLIGGALVGALSLGRSPLRGFMRLLAVIALVFLLAFALFIYPGIWLPVFPLVCAGVLAFLLVNQFVFAADEEELQRQRGQQMQRERELAISREIQTSLLPEPITRVGGCVLASRSEPAREVGGDFCSVFPLGGEEQLVGVTLGDVSGKGIRGAMYMTVATTLLEARAVPGLPPGQVLADANRRLYPKIHRLRMFVTAIYGTLDPASGEFTYASAGQVPPLRLSADGEVAYCPAAGPPLGSLSAARYRDERVTLGPGESLLLVSDGFVEARSAEGKPLGYEGLLQLVRRQLPRPPEALPESLFGAVHAYLADGDHDDLTLLLIFRQG